MSEQDVLVEPSRGNTIMNQRTTRITVSRVVNVDGLAPEDFLTLCEYFDQYGWVITQQLGKRLYIERTREKKS